MIKKSLFCVLVCNLGFTSNAQECKTILKGTVMDYEDGNPIDGASV